MLSIHSRCWLCQMPLVLAHWGLCSRCSGAVCSAESLCPRCGLPASNSRLPCGRCLKKSPPWQRLITVNGYIAPLSTLVKQLKFSGRPEIAPVLARLLLLRIRQAHDRLKPDLLVAVPLWRFRHWRRGYNQVDLLCRPLARWLGCCYQAEAIRRTRPTRLQHHLSSWQRRRNLKNAFQLEFPVQGLHIALLDDVVTTGATVAELSRLLLQNGAASVQVWCLCRTL